MTALSSWTDSATRRTIEDFVAQAVATVPVEDRVAVFDNDGTLWTEKPMPTQLHYIVNGWRAAAEADPSLAEKQPYKAAVAGDFAWIGGAVDKYYQGDDADFRLMIGSLVGTVAGVSVEDYATDVADFFHTEKHLTLQRSYADVVYQPMVELLRYLEANGFACYIVSGGERDFMRPIAADFYGIPPERVVGTAFGLDYDDDSGEVRYEASLAFFDDGAQKPVRIWSRIGRRPILAVGNSNGDMQMLDFTRKGARPGLAMIVHHDDDKGRDVAYDKGAEKALAAADERGYTLISVKDDWSRVFTGDPA